MTTYIIIAVTALISINAFGKRDLFSKLMLNPYQVYHRKEYFRVISHGFIHADWNHLIFNMLSLFFFGGIVESKLGVTVYLLLYFGGMIFSSLGSIIKHRDNYLYNSVGASGAVSAVIFASILFDPWSRILIYFLPVRGIIFAILYLIYSHYMSKKNVDNINHNAHLTGALFGITFPILINHQYLFDFIGKLIYFQ